MQDYSDCFKVYSTSLKRLLASDMKMWHKELGVYGLKSQVLKDNAKNAAEKKQAKILKLMAEMQMILDDPVEALVADLNSQEDIIF